jgi:hypothetical protein
MDLKGMKVGHNTVLSRKWIEIMLRDWLSSSSEKKDEGVERENAEDLEWALGKRDAMMGAARRRKTKRRG